MRDVLFEEVFRLLEEATCLEKSGQHRIEAATKYYESCYLMRQIVATAEAKLDGGNLEGDDITEKTIGVSSCRLLKDKIDHYTSVARKLYFDESATIMIRPQQDQDSEQECQMPATSVMIGLLDDAISVLTETQPSPPLVPVLGYHEKIPINKGNKMATGYRHNSKNKNNPKPQQKSGRTPRCALAAIERRIHLRSNLAHSTLSKAIDLDERHRMGQNNNNNNNTRQKAIDSYVEASELYLSAIQLGKEQEQKLISLSQKKPSTRSCSSAKLIETMQLCLQGLLKKLKRLLGSALDRVEALKKEEEEKFFPQQLVTAAASVAGASIYAATPDVNNVYKSWLSAKENHWNQSNQEKRNKIAAHSHRQSPTTVLW